MLILFCIYLRYSINLNVIFKSKKIFYSKINPQRIRLTFGYSRYKTRQFSYSFKNLKMGCCCSWLSQNECFANSKYKLERENMKRKYFGKDNISQNKSGGLNANNSRTVSSTDTGAGSNISNICLTYFIHFKKKISVELFFTLKQTLIF